MSCAFCDRRPLPCPNRACGEFRVNKNTMSPYSGGCGNGGTCGGQPRACSKPGQRFIDIHDVVAKFSDSPGYRFTCPPCGNEECGCPTQVLCPPRLGSCPCGTRDMMNYCCPDLPCRMRYKSCNGGKDPCCRPFPTFPKVCCPCCCRPDPGMSKRCFIPSPICPPQACAKLCLVPKQCPSPCCCCPPIPVCPPCPPYTYGGGKSCANKVPLNPLRCIKPKPTGPNPCCPRPPFGIVPCKGRIPDNYCCPKPIVIALDTPFKRFITENPECF